METPMKEKSVSRRSKDTFFSFGRGGSDFYVFFLFFFFLSMEVTLMLTLTFTEF